MKVRFARLCPHFCNNKPEPVPAVYIAFVAAVNIKSLPIVINRFQPAGTGLEKFSRVQKTAVFVYKDSGIPVAYRLFADQQDITRQINGSQMVACYPDAKIDQTSITIPVRGNIEFFEGAGIINHAV